MSEKCPLQPGELIAQPIPEFCTTHCRELWDKVGDSQADDYEVGVPDENCAHEEHPVNFSQESIGRALSSPDPSAREYWIVDTCRGCETDLGIFSRKFECPYDGSGQAVWLNDESLELRPPLNEY